MENFLFYRCGRVEKETDFCVMFEGKVVHEEATVNHQTAIMSLLRLWKSIMG